MWCHITYLPTSMMDKVMAKLMVSLFNLSTVCWARPWNRRNIIWSDAVWHWQCSSQPEPGSSTERQACTVSATPPIWPVRQFNESDLAIAKVALFLDLLSWTGLISYYIYITNLLRLNRKWITYNRGSNDNFKFWWINYFPNCHNGFRKRLLSIDVRFPSINAKQAIGNIVNMIRKQD